MFYSMGNSSIPPRATQASNDVRNNQKILSSNCPYFFQRSVATLYSGVSVPFPKPFLVLHVPMEGRVLSIMALESLELDA